MKALLKSIKGQTFYTDFIVATLIIAVAILIYYAYAINSDVSNKGNLNELVADVNTLSSSLATAGVPEEWTRDDVQRIGLTNNDRRIQSDKLEEFQLIDYNLTRKLFSTRFDYVFFLEKANGTIISVDGECSFGSPLLITDEIGGVCPKPNVSLANPSEVVSGTRFVIYGNEIIRLIVYLWD